LPATASGWKPKRPRASIWKTPRSPMWSCCWKGRNHP